jgi:hypothetical protein
MQRGDDDNRQTDQNFESNWIDGVIPCEDRGESRPSGEFIQGREYLIQNCLRHFAQMIA